MKDKNLFRAALLAAIFAAALGTNTLTLAHDKKTVSAPASLFTPDKGKLEIQLDGQTVGHDQFEIAPSGGGWADRETTELKAPQSPVARVTGALTLQSDGAPISYEWTAQTDKSNGAHILFANGIAKMTLEMQGARPFEQDLSFNTPIIAVLDNNLYYQYGVLAQIYDWSKAGLQNLPVLIPQELTPGSIQVESAGSVSANGKSYEGLRVSTSDLQVMLYLDAKHRLMRLEVPTAKVSVVRQ